MVDVVGSKLEVHDAVFASELGIEGFFGVTVVSANNINHRSSNLIEKSNEKNPNENGGRKAYPRDAKQ